MNRTSLRTTAPAVTAFALALSLSACGAGNEEPSSSGSDSSLTGTLAGAGASSQEAAVSAWQAGFQTNNPEVTVNYDPAGSGAGREQFLAGGVAFAGSDAYLDDEELTTAAERCGSDVVEVPVYVSPIAVIYQLEGVDELNLDAQTIGAIFQGDITSWDDPAIAETNPDADLPSTNITPVHRSDDSGTTENFTAYLDEASDGGWSEGAIETWPIDGGEAAQGTSGVVAAVGNGDGTIGYADASQAGELGTVKVQVGEEFTEPTPEAAALSLDAANPVEGRGETDLALDLNRTSTEAGVYPIVLVSYQLACQTYEDAAEAELVKGWLTYVASEEGQQASADTAGSAPLSPDFSEQVNAAIETIAGA
ncbi:phosphate ABC transporter substrate-binding protein PstS [Aeromicrobium sp. CF3.5]|uniref:phosphate ABC transporter substrate-binding protein PstS n=1 Tax=Aeromicrobium sp. CF3.5 TaxID=3373078 RepID=UPI003EE7233F